jgi:hypothetical protein
MDEERDQQLDQEFKLRLEKLRKQILAASIHFDICIDLWPTEERVNVINRYRGYFIPARSAHFNQFAIIIHEIFSNRENAPSFYNVFKMIRLNPNLTPGLELRLLGMRLRQHNKTKDAIMEYRNGTAAHSYVLLDTEEKALEKNEKPERKPIIFGETRKLIKEMQEIFNMISRAHSHNLWSFEPLEHNDTKHILDTLESSHKLGR